MPGWPACRWPTSQGSGCSGGQRATGCRFTSGEGFEPEEALATLAAEQVSHVSLVPPMLVELLDAAAGPPPPTLRGVLLGGGPIAPTLVERAVEAGWPVIPTYGMTETASGVTALPPSEARAHPESAGWPLAGVELRIDEPAADGIGEIAVRGAMVFGGYDGLPDETSAVLSTDGWLRTGDLGSLDRDGRLVVADRRLDLIISGGENVRPGEVEQVLREHPAVADAGVVGRPDPRWGAVPVAAIVLREAATASDAEILGHCRERLASFKVPTELVRVASLPRSTAGKLLRGDLRDEVAAAPNGLRRVERNGASIAYRRSGAPAGLPLVLLHATLSSSAQLRGLSGLLEELGPVIALDRRASGASVVAQPGHPIDVAEHVADIAAVLAAEGLGPALLVGHSYGGCVALETAARRPELVAGVVAYEPPYVAVAPPEVRTWSLVLGERSSAAYGEGGPAAAAELFMRAVSGDRAFEALKGRSRAFVLEQGGGAAADAALLGLEPAGLSRIACPVVLAAGDSRGPAYDGVADALAARIPGARLLRLPGLAHPAPVTNPERVALLVRDLHAQLVAGRLGAPTDASAEAEARTASASSPGNAASPDQVRRMFDRISPVYDLMNLLISGFQEPAWRHRAVRATGLEPGMRALDVACGTGKVSLALARRVGPAGRVIGVDFAPRMIERARRAHARPGLEFVVGDALALPVEEGVFDAATIAFGMRNLPDYRRGFSEMCRAIRPGGRVVCLEIARPRSAFARLIAGWFDRVVPLLGSLAGQGEAYAYLVRSVQAYPPPERIAEIMAEAGLVDVRWRPLSGGIVTLHVGRRPSGWGTPFVKARSAGSDRWRLSPPLPLCRGPARGPRSGRGRPHSRRSAG